MSRTNKLSAAIILLLMACLQATYAFPGETRQEMYPGEKIQDPNPEGEKVRTDIRILTLDQCIELALQNNPGLQIEREKIIELENEYRISSSGLYPKLTANAYYTRVNPDRVGVQPTMQYREESLGQLKLKQLLFDGGKTSNNGRAAEKAAEAQRESAEGTRLDTVYCGEPGLLPGARGAGTAPRRGEFAVPAGSVFQTDRQLPQIRQSFTARSAQGRGPVPRCRAKPDPGPGSAGDQRIDPQKDDRHRSAGSDRHR